MARGRKASQSHRSTPEPLARRVGARVKRLRRELDWTFDAVVGETELGRGTFSELERGLIVPSLLTLQKISIALEVPIADLVLGDTLREQLFEAARGLSNGDLRAAIEYVRRLHAPKRR